MEDFFLHLLAKRVDKKPRADGSSGAHVAWGREARGYDMRALLRLLRIEASVEEAALAWKSAGVVVLRPYRGERTLVVGCGNGPVLFGAAPVRPAALPLVPPEMRASALRSRADFGLRTTYFGDLYEALGGPDHRHEGAYTVDADPGMNPCLVATFGADDLTSVLPRGAFREIVIECICGDGARDALENWLLADGGVVTKLY